MIHSRFFFSRSFPFSGSLFSQRRECCSTTSLDFLFNPTPEHASLRETVRKFARERVAPQAREFNDVRHEFNTELFKELVDLGLIGIQLPVESGGSGLDATAVVIAAHELCKFDPAFTLSAYAHAILFVNNFFWSATQEQKDRFLARSLRGEIIGGMAMSEPGAGTDVLSMTTVATKSDEGSDGTPCYILNGSKTWITNGPIGDIFIVYAKNLAPELLSSTSSSTPSSSNIPIITAFLVEKGTKGFSVGPSISKIGMGASPTGPLYFDNVRIPISNVLGGKPNGLVGMMRNLEIERILLSAMSVGIADQCTELMLKYANERKAFGKSISNFGQIQRYIAESFAKTEAAKTLTYAVARTISPGTQNRIGSDAAKLFAAPVGKEVADAAIQVMGGMGYSRDMPVERLWRDSKLVEIGGGTLEAHHKNLMKDLKSLMK